MQQNEEHRRSGVLRRLLISNVRVSAGEAGSAFVVHQVACFSGCIAVHSNAHQITPLD